MWFLTWPPFLPKTFMPWASHNNWRPFEEKTNSGKKETGGCCFVRVLSKLFTYGIWGIRLQATFDCPSHGGYSQMNSSSFARFSFHLFDSLLTMLFDRKTQQTPIDIRVWHFFLSFFPFCFCVHCTRKLNLQTGKMYADFMLVLTQCNRTNQRDN